MISLIFDIFGELLMRREIASIYKLSELSSQPFLQNCVYVRYAGVFGRIEAPFGAVCRQLPSLQYNMESILTIVCLWTESLWLNHSSFCYDIKAPWLRKTRGEGTKTDFAPIVQTEQLFSKYGKEFDVL